ncbi:hypothetical protein F2Q68_00044631 [Brassica cretica]|uniref:Uncharacterized protein n=1 Tax=Brassica cretica TaxID=69181 RepID=A0A8S9LKS4_BRACR|nr:hypothetical protein F2Q68_00044631 [Brassica cretica]
MQIFLTLRYTIQPLPEIHFKTHHCPRTGAYSSIPAVQAPTSPPHHNDSPLSPSPSVEHSELQEVARKGLRLRSQDESYNRISSSKDPDMHDHRRKTTTWTNWKRRQQTSTTTLGQRKT